MLDNIKVYTSDTYWNQILSDLGAVMVDSAKLADVVFDELQIDTPISVMDLQNIILSKVDNSDIIRHIFGGDVKLSNLQHRLIVFLHKNPNTNMHDLKIALGISPDITTHAVETAIYQLRKIYGHNIIENINGKYKIGRV